ncbi:MAG: ATP-binding cassette domain-containing protein [Planctomycetota bacterium]
MPSGRRGGSGGTDAAQLGAGLQVRDLGFSYGSRRLLNGVSLSIPSNEVHCLIGPSGTGKSTLLRLISGLERPLRGLVTIDAVDVAGSDFSYPPERRPVGLVFQDFQLFPHISAKRNVMFGALSRSRRERAAEAHHLLDKLGLVERSDALPHELSGGEQQRVAVARALARRPRVLLMDEPFRSLDAEHAEKACEVTLNAIRATSAAVLIVTHDHQEAMGYADRIWSLSKAGVLTQSGSNREHGALGDDRAVPVARD